MDEPAIDATGLRKAFGGHVVLDGVGLTVAPGELLALLGPNGSGKTTTVRVLTTLLAADAGTATVGGHDVAREPARARAAIGLTAQQATVDPLLTGRENLELFAGLHHLGRGRAGRRAVRRRAAELLERFDLVTAANRRASTYSGGMRRRLDLATSMIAEPRILFLDEPTTGLDPRSRAELWATIRELLAGGTTVLLTTQYLDEADALADRVAVLDAGRVVADDTPAVLKRRVGTERLVLRLARADDTARATALLPGSTAGADDPRVLDVAAHGPDAVREALVALHDHGVTVEHVELRRPTLDDVFFALTTADGARATGAPAVTGGLGATAVTSVTGTTGEVAA